MKKFVKITLKVFRVKLNFENILIFFMDRSKFLAELTMGLKYFSKLSSLFSI